MRRCSTRAAPVSPAPSIASPSRGRCPIMRSTVRRGFGARYAPPRAARSPRQASGRGVSPGSPSTPPARWRHSTPTAVRSTVSTTGRDEWKSMMWADHRAIAEAEEITATGHRALAYVGGTMSPEMELPKLLWLKRHLPQAWARYGLALDLTDFLTWRASGRIAVSACTITCKWAYLNHEEPGWQSDLLEVIGLMDLPARAHLPQRPFPIGSVAGNLTRGRGRRARSHGAVRGRRRSHRRACGRTRIARRLRDARISIHAWR